MQLCTSAIKHISMDADKAARTWAKLEHAIGMIHAQQSSQLSFEECYRSAYEMVVHRWGDMLYEGMERALQAHLRQVASELIEKPGIGFVHDVLTQWQRYHKSTLLIRDILMYMDRTYVSNLNRTGVFERGMQIWTAEIIRKQPIGPELRARVLAEVARERSGEAVDRGTLRAVSQMLMDLGVAVYERELEAQFLAASTQHCKAVVQRCLQSMDCPAYWLVVEQRIGEEEERASAYMLHNTKEKLLERVLDIFVRAQLETVLRMEGTGLVNLLDNDRVDVLGRIYGVAARVPDMAPATLRAMLQAHVTAVGKALVQDGEAVKDPVVFTQKLLDLRDKYIRIIDIAFQHDRQFLMAVNQAFEGTYAVQHFINSFPRSAEYISLYIDSCLRKQLAAASDTQAEETLEKVLQVFRYLQEKDLFQQFYKQHLSKRLLAGRVANDDVERIMLGKLKTECGYNYTHKLEGMFLDVRTSVDTTAAFREWLPTAPQTLPIDLQVQVLTTGYWPTGPGQKCVLPAPAETAAEMFQSFYNCKHNGRKLAWVTGMGTADLRVEVQGRRREITVTTQQMVVLMLLNESDELSFADILEVTDISREELKPALIGLSMVKGKALLKKVPQTKEIGDSDVFSFNERFDSKLTKIKFAAAGGAKGDSEVGLRTRQKVEDDRKHVIEAAIVRTMKSRRVLDYNSIIAEVTRQLSHRFAPLAVDIKKRMEHLIEREYLERDPADRKMYRYMA